MSRILVVDDSPTQRTLLAGLLSNDGFDVETANEGEEAIARLESKPSDLVVTDMDMPRCNGVELIRSMQSVCPRVPAILVTAHGSETLAAEALGVGAAGYIAKENLSAFLCESAARMVGFARANSETLAIKAALTPMRFELVIDCMPERLVPVVELHLRMLTSMGLLRSSQRVRIAETLYSLLSFCVLHCNLEHPLRETPISHREFIRIFNSSADSYPDRIARPVTLTTDVGENEIRFEVQHSGDDQILRSSPLPGTPASFHDERGRRMLLLTSVMDEVIFGTKNQISLVKHRSQTPI
ncbi:MAG: response regulator [Planctomycetota bacterium]